MNGIPQTVVLHGSYWTVWRIISETNHVTCLHAHITVLYLCATYVLCANRKPHKANQARSDSREVLHENEYTELRPMVYPGKRRTVLHLHVY